MFRDNDCHFSAAGLNAAAELWAETIVLQRIQSSTKKK
jgi:hypothetical protein